MIRIKLRPSSHSGDYTVMATYRDENSAELARGKLSNLVQRLACAQTFMEKKVDIDWNASEATCRRTRKTVYLTANTDGTFFGEVEQVLRDEGSKEVQTLEDYQELVVSIKVQPEVTLDALSLLLPKDDAQALAWLVAECGRPEERVTKGGKLLSWEYCGGEIYDEDRNEVYVGFWLSLDRHKKWHVNSIRG